MNAAPKQVLLVEDEWLIANAFAEELREGGYAVVGPAPTAVAALALIESTVLDAAALDINLREETSFVVAEALAAKDVPFLFMSGCREADLPAAYRDRALIGKPAPHGDLCAGIAALLHNRDSRESLRRLR